MKKLLLLVLLLIPFVVQAEEPVIKKRWEVKSPYEFSDSFEAGEYFIKYKNGYFLSINKENGSSNDLELPVSGQSPNYHSIIKNNKVIIVLLVDNHYVVRTYDLALNKINEIDIGQFQLAYIGYYDDDYFLILGKTYEGFDYYAHAFFIDYDGNLYKHDSIKTINYPSMYSNKYRENVFISDNYNSDILIQDYSLVPSNLNSDGTYMIAKSQKILKVDREGTIVKELSIPTGNTARIAKKGNNYYVMAGIRTKVNNKYYFQVKIYKTTEDLNGFSDVSGLIPAEPIAYGGNENFTRYDYNIYNLNDDIYISLRKDDDYHLDDYLLSESFGYTKLDNPNDSIYNDLYPHYGLTYNEYQPYRFFEVPSLTDSKSFYLNKWSYIDNEEDNLIADIINSLREQDEVNAAVRISYVKDDNNYIIAATYINNFGSEDVTKLKLYYIDELKGLLFTKLIYDWTPYIGSGSCKKQVVYNSVSLFDDYISVAANSNVENYFQVYDKDGELVLDFSDDFNAYHHLSINSLFKYKNGMFIEFTIRTGECYYGVSQYTNNNVLGASLVLGATQDLETKTILAYYAYPYNISTNVKGKGTIETSYVKAAEGTAVQFTVTPEEGYVLSVVKVIDSKGNVLTFTENTFTMPDADVTIEATFVLASSIINPETGEIAIIAILIASLIFGVIVVIQKRKYEFLK